MNYKVKDIGLAKEGENRVQWAEDHMPVIDRLVKKHESREPLEGIRIGGAIHVTKETAVLLNALRALGADVSWCGCNPLSTQDDVAAYMAKNGIGIFAWRGVNDKEYYWCIDQVIGTKPMVTMDDGADLVFRFHAVHQNRIGGVIGGTEETTTGVHRLKSMASEGKLRYPIIAVNNAETKWDFDNIYGTGQGTVDAIMRSTSMMITGKTVAVAGYGHCGKGVAARCKGMGANVIITEVDSLQGLRAVMDGFRVMMMSDAIKHADIVITATGCKSVVTKEHFPSMKDGVVLLNVGHFDVEVRVDQLRQYAKSVREIRPNCEQFVLKNGKKAYLIAQGRLANLGAAEGHPSEVMDLSFSNQILAVLSIAKNHENMERKVHELPRSQDELIAKLKLESMGMSIDTLTPEQFKYLHSWEEGT